MAGNSGNGNGLKRNGGAAAPAPALVTIRDRFERLAEIPASMPLAELAEKWGYVLQSRRRWAGSLETRRQQGELAEASLDELEIDSQALDRIADAGHVEVAIGRQADIVHGDARRVPWEYLLSAATASRRGTRPLLVTRCLAGDAFPHPRSPKSLLFIESAPGLLKYEYEFESERKIVSGGLNLDNSEAAISKNEGIDVIKARLGDGPDIIHFAGFDSRQATLLDTSISARTSSEGIVLTDNAGAPYVATAEEFSSWIGQGAKAPILVAFNCHYSATDFAALCVSAGASAAVGFADAVDDEIGEFFFGAFYREWRLGGWDLVSAFTAVWASLRSSMPRFHGTGIVLWAAESAFPQWREAAPEAPVIQEIPVPTARRGRFLKKNVGAGATAPPPPPPEPPTGTGSGAGAGAPPPPPGPPAGIGGGAGWPFPFSPTADPRSTFTVKIKPLKEINYSLLHNDQPIFEEFAIIRIKDGPDVPIEVKVELNVGSDSYPFRLTTIFPNSLSIYPPDIKIPLISSLVRSLRERLQSTLYWRVSVDGVVINEETQKVTLLPVDEWSDDVGQPVDKSTVDRRSIWLPSFVLPRDPAVARIIESAQRYLMALQDDPGAGFDGYQQVDPQDPATREMVDLQVRAIWCALAFEWQLSYINPPPSYSRATQRLRTPSDVINGKRGTCIDLALLLAACLEFVDIYPALFLLTGHAFPAYWRSEEPHERFVLADRSLLSGRPQGGQGTASPRKAGTSAKRRSWVFRKDDQALNELQRYIQRGDLVPLETVYLTNDSSFADACTAGLENLDNPREFDSMLDILQARRDTLPVTPLPIIQI